MSKKSITDRFLETEVFRVEKKTPKGFFVRPEKGGRGKTIEGNQAVFVGNKKLPWKKIEKGDLIKVKPKEIKEDKALYKKLKKAKSREKAHELLKGKKKKELLVIAKALHVAARAGDKVARIRDKIVEATVGHRLDAEAIRRSGRKEKPSIAGRFRETEDDVPGAIKYVKDMFSPATMIAMNKQVIEYPKESLLMAASIGQGVGRKIKTEKGLKALHRAIDLYGLYVKFTGLRPNVDAKEFRTAFDIGWEKSINRGGKGVFWKDIKHLEVKSKPKKKPKKKSKGKGKLRTSPIVTHSGYKVPKIVTHKNLDKVYREVTKDNPGLQPGSDPETIQSYRDPDNPINQKVLLQVALGEIAGGGLKTIGIIGKDIYKNIPIPKGAQWEAQGLEGAIEVEKRFLDALQAMDIQVTKNRGRIVTM